MGRLELSRDGRPVLARRRKELALLAYLTRRSPRPADRAALASLLWGSRGDEARARASLRQALFDLREALGDDVVQADQATARVDPRTITLDVASFEAAVAAGRLAEAAAHWQGPFLDGLEDLGDESWLTWVQSERAALRAKFGVVLSQLTDAAEAGGDQPAAIRWSQRHLEVMPHDEAAAIRLVSLLRRSGRAAEAKSTAAGYMARLRHDLDTEPSAALLELDAEAGSPIAIGRPGGRGLVSPDLTGRAAALAALAEACDGAVGGDGRVILVEGDEGSGKTRLVEAFVASGAGLGRQVFLGRAFPSESDQSWAALRSVLAQAFLNGAGVAGAPPDALASAAVVVPELRERFPTVGAPPAEHRPGPALYRILAEMAAESPIVLVVDDAPHADGDSAALIAELMRRPPHGLLLVLTGRPDGWLDSHLAAGYRDLPDAATRIVLSPLSSVDAAALIGSMAPFEPASGAALADRLWRETAGNPGHLVHLVQQLADDGRLAPRPDGIWVADGLDRPLPLEGGLRDSVRDRLAGLSDQARRLIEAGAVLGPVVDPQLLEVVSGLSPVEYRDALGTALSRRLVRESAARGGRLEFINEASRRAVYGQIAPSARSRLHAAAAGALARGVGESRPEEIDRHRRLAAPRRSRLLRVALATAVLAAAAVGTLTVRSRGAARVSPGTPVLVASFQNATGDADFDGSLQTAVEIGLQESGHVWLLSKARIGDALKRGGHGVADTIVTGELAREVAVRENVPLVIEMALARPGNEYLLTGRIVRAATGGDLRSFQTRLASREAVLGGLSDVVARIRAALGEADSLRPAAELPALTTASIAALKLYADGEAAWNRRDWVLAETLLQRAVSLDSTFAMAHVLLARHSHLRANDRPAALAALAAARRWSAHLTARELLALEIEEASSRGQSRTAAALTELMAARYPSPASVGSHATTLMRADRCAEAVPVFRRALGMAPRSVSNWINLATCYQIIDSLPAALQAYAEAERVDSTILSRDNLNQEWGRVFVRMGRLSAADSAFRRMLAQPDAPNRARGLRSLGLLAMTRGDYRAALADFSESSRHFAAAGSPLGAARSETLAAQAAAALGEDAEARARLGAVARMLTNRPLEPVYHLYVGLTHLRVGDVSGAQVWLTRLDRLAEPGAQSDTAVRNLLAARIAIARGDLARARVLVPERVPAFASFLRPLLLETMGRIHEGLGHPDSALAALRWAQAFPTWGTELQEQWERLPLSIAAAELAVGDSAEARAALSEILAQWKDAPLDFPDRRRAREKLLELQVDLPR